MLNIQYVNYHKFMIDDNIVYTVVRESVKPMLKVSRITLRFPRFN